MASAEGQEPAGSAPAEELPSRSILVLYGSETGNSQEIAEDLDRIAQRMRFESRAAEMNSVQLVCSRLTSRRGACAPISGAVTNMDVRAPFSSTHS